MKYIIFKKETLKKYIKEKIKIREGKIFGYMYEIEILYRVKKKPEWNINHIIQYGD